MLGNRFLNSIRHSLSKEKKKKSSQSSLVAMSTSSNEQNLNDTSSFLSIVMSTILKHHLSWVFTVLPSNNLESSNKSNSILNNSTLRKQRAHWTSILEKTNPYNPLWAQLGDLHGAVNQPLRLVRTVVVGKDKELVERLLTLLSYFIRCSNSSYFDISAEKFDFDKLSGQTSPRTSSSSASSIPSASPKQRRVIVFLILYILVNNRNALYIGACNKK